MKQWFLQFKLREQLALLAMVAAVVIYLVFMVLVLPLGSAREDLMGRNTATAEALQRVDAMASEIRHLRQAGSAKAGNRGRNLTALLNSSAERFELSITRLQPNSRGAVQVRFEGVALEQLLRWIHELEGGRGLLLEELSLTQGGAAGFVNASLRVSAPG